jgi:hypothetical protein
MNVVAARQVRVDVIATANECFFALIAGPCQASRRCRKDATIAMCQRLAANDRRPRPGGDQARSRSSNQMPVVWKLAS